MGMELHRLADHVGDLVILAVIDLEEGVENAALNGLQSVVDFRNSPVFLRRRWRIRGSTGRIGFLHQPRSGPCRDTDANRFPGQ